MYVKSLLIFAQQHIDICQAPHGVRMWHMVGLKWFSLQETSFLCKSGKGNASYFIAEF